MKAQLRPKRYSPRKSFAKPVPSPRAVIHISPPPSRALSQRQGHIHQRERHRTERRLDQRLRYPTPNAYRWLTWRDGEERSKRERRDEKTRLWQGSTFIDHHGVTSVCIREVGALVTVNVSEQESGQNQDSERSLCLIFVTFRNG